MTPENWENPVDEEYEKLPGAKRTNVEQRSRIFTAITSLFGELSTNTGWFSVVSQRSQVGSHPSKQK